MRQSIVSILTQSVLAGGALGFVLCWVANGPFAALTGRDERRRRKLDAAIEQGHRVTAHLIRYYDDGNYERREDAYIATYEYSIDGRHYRRTYSSGHRPSPEIAVYWLSNPANAAPLDILEQHHKHLDVYVAVCILLVLFFRILFT